MKLPRVLAVLMDITLLFVAIGCSVGTGELDIQATVEAKGKQEVAVSPTPMQQTDTPKLDAITEAKVGAASSDESFQQTNVTALKKCTLSGGETVESGWSGKDTGDNYCNNCFCSNSVLGCTRMACGVFIPTSSPEPNTPVPTDTSSASKPPAVGVEDHTNRLVGNKVGDISPDFSILLTTGETLYSSTIRSDRMPVFLFFFSPL